MTRPRLVTIAHLAPLLCGVTATLILLTLAWPTWPVVLVALTFSIPLSYSVIRRWSHAKDLHPSLTAQVAVDAICHQAGLPATPVVLDDKIGYAAFQAYNGVMHVGSAWLELYDNYYPAATAIAVHELGHRAQHSKPFILPALYLRILALYLGLLTLFTTNSIHQPLVVALAGLAWALGTALERAATRYLEYDADQFTTTHGYGLDLVSWLAATSYPYEPPLIRIFNTHPTPASRVARLVGVVRMPCYSP